MTTQPTPITPTDPATEELPTVIPPRLSLPRLQRLSVFTDLVIAGAALCLAALGLCITLAFRDELMPTYARGGPREWATSILLALVLAAVAVLIHDRVHEEVHAGRDPELPTDPYYGNRIGWAALAIALFTTQPMWLRVADWWRANDSHAAQQVLGALLAHLIPALVILGLARIAPRLATGYRMFLHGQQYDQDPTPREDNPRRDRAGLWAIAKTQARAITDLRSQLTATETSFANAQLAYAELTQGRDQLARERDELAEQLLTAERVTEQQTEEIQRLRGAPRVESGWD